MSRTVAAAIFVVFLAGAAAAQTPAVTSGPAAWTGLPDTFQVDAGVFRVSGDTTLRATVGSGSASDINFEKELGFDKNATTYWVYARWRPWRRHQLSLGYTSIQRDSATRTLDQTFTWNGQVYDAGLTATASSRVDLFTGIYRFSAIKRDRYEFGPAAGFGFVYLSANISAQGTVVSGGESVTKNLNEGRSGRFPTGDVGGFVNFWVTRRAVVRGDFLYIYIAPGDIIASVTDGRLAFDYYPWQHVGFGAQYKYNQFRYEQGADSSSLGGRVTYQGAQIYMSFLF